MKIFLAGAGGAIGRQLTPLLCRRGHDVTGTTRSPDKADAIAALGARPVVVDVFDAPALAIAVASSRPQVIIHQLTDLPAGPDSPDYAAGQQRNRRLRTEGTANLVAAAKAAGVTRMVAQSIAFTYAPGEGPRTETDPLDLAAEGTRADTVAGAVALEEQVLALPEGIVLRYGFFYGPGTWSPDAPDRRPAIHVDAAAHAALLALTGAAPGIYNVAEDHPTLSSDKAKRTFAFDASVRSVRHPEAASSAKGLAQER